MDFIKAHACGNDFLYVEEAAVPAGADPAALARALCHRTRGIGADGLILFRRLPPGGAAMRLINADGSPSEISGNGVRGLAAVLCAGAPDEPPAAAAPGIEVTVATGAGEKRLTLLAREGRRWQFRAAMGQPSRVARRSIDVAGERLDVIVLSVGNPQCVVLGPLPDPARFARLGPAIATHETFPEGTNVEFAEVESPGRVRILIWERGVGPTEASGTGACAAAVAAAVFGGARRDVEVASPGGSQRVEWQDEGLYLTGWAEIVCRGFVAGSR